VKSLIDKINDFTIIHLGLMDVPQPLSVTYKGLLYSGEIIVADKWDSELALEITNGCHFRLVVVRDGNEFEGTQIQGNSMAVCFMERSYQDPQLSAVVQADPDYVNESDTTAKDEGGWQIFWPMEVEPTLAAKIFYGDNPSLWLERIASILIEWNYPYLPVQLELLKEPITDIDAQILIDELFESGKTNQTLKVFGPALGLSRAYNPSIFDPSSCRVFSLIERELDNENHDVGWEYLTKKMIWGHGLTHNLAKLFILSFVFYKNPRMELALLPGHDLTFKCGEPFNGDKITFEIIPTIDWRHDLNNTFRLLRYEQRITFNGSIPYVSLIIPQSKKFKFMQQGVVDNNIIEEGLAKLKECLPLAIQTMKSLLDVTGVYRSGHLVESLSNLKLLAQARDFSEIYHEARRTFGNPIELSKALVVLESAKNINRHIPELNRMIQFLTRSEVDQTSESLYIQWNKLIEEVSPGKILSKSWSWWEVQKDFSDFKGIYLIAYHRHHKGYQTQIREMIIETDRYQIQLDLLKRFNGIHQLETRGYNLDRGLSIVKKNIKICSDSIEGIVPEGGAVCANCELVLTDKFPTIEMKQLSKELEEILRDQIGELHFLLLNRSLQERPRSGIEKSVMQTLSGDLWTLAETLDDEMISYINNLIEGA